MFALLSRLGAALMSLLVVVVVVAGSSVVTAPLAQAALDRTSCLRDGNVWVVVLPDDATVQTGCATEFGTGSQALTSAGFTPDNPSFVRQINGQPATVSNDHYWSYWHSDQNAAGAFTGYSYSQLGAGSYRPQPGSIETWRYVPLTMSPAQATPTQPLPAPLPLPTTMGDQDGNGQADVVAIDEQGRLLQYSVRGRRQSAPYVIGSGWGSFTWLQVVPDLNGNKISELVGRRSDGTLWLYWGAGRGVFSSAVQIGAGWNGMSLLTVMDDLTGDGRPDLLGRAADGRLIRYSFTAKGPLAGAAVIGRNWNGIRATATVGDFSGDARPDLLAISASGDLLRYAFGANATISSTTKVGQNWGGMGMMSSPGDLTRDGKRDLVALRNDGTLWVYPVASAGRWGSAYQQGSAMTAVRLLA